MKNEQAKIEIKVNLNNGKNIKKRRFGLQNR